MDSVPIDLTRLNAIRAAAGRERAAHAAAGERLNSAMAADSNILREMRSFENRKGREHAADDAQRWNALQARRRAAETEILEATAELEDAKERLSTANQLRAACEHHAGYRIGFGSEYHGS